MDRRSQHLKAAAQADELAAVAQVARNRLVPPVRAQPGEVGAHVLAAGQDDEIGGGNGFIRADKAQRHLRVQTQRIEIRVVTDARQHRHDHAQTSWSSYRFRISRQRVFGFEMQAVQVGQHAEHRLAGLAFEPFDSRLQQRQIAAESG